MSSLLRSALLIGVVLLVPILPFLVFGSQFTAWFVDWSKQPASAPLTAAAVVTLLATDIFLPVPSSLVSTLGGWRLGWWAGTLASWVGMSLGAIIGYTLARRWGRRFALWFSRGEELDRMAKLSRQYGPIVLVMTRGVPVLAEASVLLMGIHRLGWMRFLPATLLSNLGIALAYSAFGTFAEQHGWLPLALGVSIGLPVLLAAIVERWVSAGSRPETHDPGHDKPVAKNARDDASKGVTSGHTRRPQGNDHERDP